MIVEGKSRVSDSKCSKAEKNQSLAPRWFVVFPRSFFDVPFYKTRQNKTVKRGRKMSWEVPFINSSSTHYLTHLTYFESLSHHHS